MGIWLVFVNYIVGFMRSETKYSVTDFLCDLLKGLFYGLWFPHCAIPILNLIGTFQILVHMRGHGRWGCGEVVIKNAYS